MSALRIYARPTFRVDKKKVLVNVGPSVGNSKQCRCSLVWFRRLGLADGCQEHLARERLRAAGGASTKRAQLIHVKTF